MTSKRKKSNVHNENYSNNQLPNDAYFTYEDYKNFVLNPPKEKILKQKVNSNKVINDNENFYNGNYRNENLEKKNNFGTNNNYNYENKYKNNDNRAYNYENKFENNNNNRVNNYDGNKNFIREGYFNNLSEKKTFKANFFDNGNSHFENNQREARFLNNYREKSRENYMYTEENKRKSHSRNHYEKYINQPEFSVFSKDNDEYNYNRERSYLPKENILLKENERKKPKKYFDNLAKSKEYSEYSKILNRDNSKYGENTFLSTKKSNIVNKTGENTFFQASNLILGKKIPEFSLNTFTHNCPRIQNNLF